MCPCQCPVLCSDFHAHFRTSESSHANTTQTLPGPTTHDQNQPSPAQTETDALSKWQPPHHSHSPARTPTTSGLFPTQSCARLRKGRLFPSSSFLALPWLLFPLTPLRTSLPFALPSLSAALPPIYTRRRVHSWKRPAELPHPLCFPVCYGTPSTQFTPLDSGLTVPCSTLALPLAGAVEGRIICSPASTHSLVPPTHFATSAHSFDSTHELVC